MAINLDAPLAWKKADSDELKMLQNLQGNILKGHGRDYTANIFFRFDPDKNQESRRMLRELANFHLTSAYRQLLDSEKHKATHKGKCKATCEDSQPFVHLALSFAGYRALGLEGVAPADVDFRGGMKSDESVNALADPPVSEWEGCFQKELHGMVLAAHETESETAALAGSMRELIEKAGGKVVLIQHGKALRNAAGVGIENFGYVDGRSQPLMLLEDIDDEAKTAGTSRWDPAFPLRTALFEDPGAPDGLSHGSLFVFRKLEQDVRGFKTREQEIADVLGLTEDARELAGAMIVGRFEDGTPVTLSDEALGDVPPNNFNYAGDQGFRCPFHGHIRKTNPRGSGGAESEPDERKHLMARRGIPFEDVKRTVHPDELPEAGTMAEFQDKVAPLLPTGGVGLLFMAYNNEIGAQFKFTQSIWVNNPNFPIPGTHGIDPVIGQGASDPNQQELPNEWDNPTKGKNNNVNFDGFVKMKGGEYMFSPSLTFLASL